MSVGLLFPFQICCASLTCCLLLILYDRFLCTTIDCSIAFGISLFGIFTLTNFVAKTRSVEVLVLYGAQHRLPQDLIAATGVEAFKAKHATTVNFPVDIASTKAAVKHMSTQVCEKSSWWSWWARWRMPSHSFRRRWPRAQYSHAK